MDNEDSNELTCRSVAKKYTGCDIGLESSVFQAFKSKINALKMHLKQTGKSLRSRVHLVPLYFSNPMNRYKDISDVYPIFACTDDDRCTEVDRNGC